MLKEMRPTGDDVREGLIAVVSVKLPKPQFEGQTKTKLGNGEVEGFVSSAVNERLGAFFEEHPKEGKAIVEKGMMAAEAREAARKARELTRRKNSLEGSMLPGKLSDCRSEEQRRRRRFSWSKGIRPAGRPSRGGIRKSRPFCRFAVRS